MTRVTRVTAYRLDLPFRDGGYCCSGGRSAIGFDSLVVRLDTDEDVARIEAVREEFWPGKHCVLATRG